MYNIRIKQLPKNGDQRNYSLVDRNDLYIKTNPVNSDSNVKNTISAVPREEANIEAEGGETVIGDINNDGFLEHSKIVGKRHTEGGVPLNVAPGSFIFSDTKKLKIKDPEVLSIFGINNVPKGGITPAKIAQKYPMNNYMNTLKDNVADPVAKRTATQMMKNNLEKLGMLALVQESMKGFPDGIPAIAESVMAGLQGMQMPGQEQSKNVAHETMEGAENEMKYGGGYYQNAGTTKEKQKSQKNKVTSAGNPIEGYKFYNGITPVTVTKVNSNYGIENPNAPYIELSDGERLTKKQFELLQSRGFYNYIHGGIGDVYTAKPWVQKRKILDSDGNPVKGLELYSGDKINFNGNDYTIVNPNADNSRGYYDTMKPLRDMFDNTQGIIHVRNNKTGQYEYLEGEDLGDAYKFDAAQVPIIPNQNLRSAYTQSMDDIIKYGQMKLNDSDYEIVEPSYVKQNSENKPYVSNRKTGQNPVLDNAKAIDTSSVINNTSSTNVQNKKNVSQPSAVKTVITPTTKTNVAPKPVKKIAGKMQTIPNFIVPSGQYKGQQVKAVQRGDTIRAYYPNGTHEAFLNGAIIPGYKHGGDLPKHQGTLGSSTVGDNYGSSMMDDGAVSTFDQQVVDATINPAITSATSENAALFQPAAQPIVTSQPAVAPTMEGIQNGAVAPVSAGDPNKKVIVNNSPTFEISPRSVKSLPFTPKDKSTYTPWKPENYDTQWKPMAEQAMLNPEGAKAIDEYLTGLVKSNTFGPNIAAQLEGLTGQARYDKILELATDGKPGLFHNAFLEAMTPKPPDTPETPETPVVPEKIPDVPVINKSVVKRRRPWWIQDAMTYAGAMTDIVRRYPPAMSKVNLETPGYVTKDPDRRIAAMQEQEARRQEMLMNSTAGNVAGASILGQTDQRLGQSANIIGDVENENVNIVNQALARNSQITNQESILNENAKQKYIAENAIMNQNYDNALREQKWRQIKAWNNGTTNWMRHKQMEDVLFPNVGIDSNTGDVYFPRGREAFDAQGKPVYDPYINPTSSNSTNNKYDANDYITLFNKLRTSNPGISDSQIDAAVKYQLTGKFVEQPQNQFANAMALGQTLPSEMTSNKYGGRIKKQYGGQIFDFGALPLYFFED